MPLKVTNSAVNNNTITITFSSPVVSDSTTDTASATNPANYTIFDPGSVDFSQPQTLADVTPGVATPSLDSSGRFLIITFNPGSNTITSEFQSGDWVHITVNNVTAQNGDTLEGGQASFARQVPGAPPDTRRTTRDIEDAISYPVLTEEVAYRPSSPVGVSTTGAGGIASPGAFNIGQTALQAVTDVLGWKVNPADPKGFVGALTQSFDLTEVEGHVESKWVPRSYAVQTDLGGGITGAQASLYMRAKDALEQSLTLLDGLYPLDPDADPEYVKALREMARSQMSEIVKELGTVGLPSILRIDTYFQILLGQHPTRGFTKVEFAPDKIKGTLGKLRDTYGIYFRGNPWNNSVEDEQDITNFRVISDYMTSLLQSWIENRQYFVVQPDQLAFFGTQLVLISRQLNVIAETVNEVRFALDSVFIGPNERQSLLLVFKDTFLPPMFLEDMLVEIVNFVTDEGPQLLRDGGKISVTNNILPVVGSLLHLVDQAHDPANRDKIPDGYRTIRVRRSLDDLRDQLAELIRLSKQVEQQLPIPQYALTLSDVLATSTSDGEGGYVIDLSFLGSGIDPRATITLRSPAAIPATDYTVVFYSAERIDVSFDVPAADTTPLLDNGDHEIKVINPDDESATLRFNFTWDGGQDSPTVTLINGGNGGYGGGGGGYGGSGGGGGSFAPSLAPRAAVRPRTVVIETGGAGGGAAASSTAAAIPAPAPAAAGSAPATIPASAAAGTPATPSAAVATSPSADDVAALHDRINDLQESHKTLAQEVRDGFGKIADFLEGKGKHKKGKE